MSLTFLPAVDEALSHAKRVVIGFSGGLDSTVLLHLIAARVDASRLLAVHIHHGLSPNADAWASHASAVCQDLNIPFELVSVTLQDTKAQGLEGTARAVRHEVFERMLRKDDVLLLAHHQDDQAETFLLNLMRGAGLRGLAAMPSVMPFGLGYKLRPLLLTSRQWLEDYAREYQLSWVEDESNQSLQFDRNRIRHEVLPLLQSRWPVASQKIAQAASQLAQDDALLTAQVEASLKGVLLVDDQMSLSALLAYPENLQSHLIRQWCRTLGHNVPNQAHLTQILQLCHARSDAQPEVAWDRCCIKRYRDRLYLLPRSGQEKALSATYEWDICHPFQLSDGRTIRATKKQGEGLGQEYAPLKIAFRQGGERCTPAGRQGSRSLKDLFQEAGIPPWQRAQYPLLYCGDRLVSVPGVCVSKEHAVSQDELGLVFELC